MRAPVHIRGRRTDARGEAAGFSHRFQRILSPANFRSLAAEGGAEMTPARGVAGDAGNRGRLSLQPGTHRARSQSSRLGGCRQGGTQNLTGGRQRAGVPGPAPLCGVQLCPPAPRPPTPALSLRLAPSSGICRPHLIQGRRGHSSPGCLLQRQSEHHLPCPSPPFPNHLNSDLSLPKEYIFKMFYIIKG